MGVLAQLFSFNRSNKGLAQFSDAELVTLAILSEESAARTYLSFHDALVEDYPESARVFAAMAAEENTHRRRLSQLFEKHFGLHLPKLSDRQIRAAELETAHQPLVIKNARSMRERARQMEQRAAQFYQDAQALLTNVAARDLFGELSIAESGHEDTFADIDDTQPLSPELQQEEDSARRRLILQIIQPGLVGLMDGSVSTLAPVFAAAFATHDSWDAFRVGLAASVGAGISMGFAEALADDGDLSGRGKPLMRGIVCGFMTIAGGIGHTLPYLIPDFWLATMLAIVVVFFELLAIAWIQWRFMDSPPLSAAAKVMLGGAVVLVVGIWIGGG